MLIMPVANGIMPRPEGGRIFGLFDLEQGGKAVLELGEGGETLICPWVTEEETLYPVGVVARIVDISMGKAVVQTGEERDVLLAVLEGRGQARWNELKTVNKYLVASDWEYMNLAEMRQEYPAISGAGWLPGGGFTEFKGKSDVPVTIYGQDLETGRPVSLKANLGGLVEEEHAHTVEHAIIRALRTYGLCTPRTLAGAMARETDELKRSVEFGFRFAMPEILGITSSGMCGNPMTNMAQFYLAKEFVDNIYAGKGFGRSLAEARRTTMSRLTQEIGLTSQPGLRVLQGLKKGMSHDDTPLKLEIYKKIIGRFPRDPWA